VDSPKSRLPTYPQSLLLLLIIGRYLPSVSRSRPDARGDRQLASAAVCAPALAGARPFGWLPFVSASGRPLLV